MQSLLALSNPQKIKLPYQLRLLVSLALVYLVLYNLDWKATWSVIASVHWLVYGASYLLSLGGTLGGQVWVTSKLSENLGSPIVLQQAAKIWLRMNILSLTLPTGVTTGMLWLSYYKFGLSKVKAMLVIFNEKLVYLWSLLILGSLSFGLTRIVEHKYHMLAMLGALILITLSLSWESLMRILPRPIRRLSLIRARYLAITCAGLLTAFTGQYLVLIGWGVSIPLTGWILARSVMAGLVLLPVTVGGIGLREVSLITLLSMYGVGKEQVLAMSLIIYSYRLLTVGVALVYESVNRKYQAVNKL